MSSVPGLVIAVFGILLFSAGAISAMPGGTASNTASTSTQVVVSTVSGTASTSTYTFTTSSVRTTTQAVTTTTTQTSTYSIVYTTTQSTTTCAGGFYGLFQNCNPSGYWGLVVNTVAPAGNNVAGSISIDGQSVGTGTFSGQYVIGNHVIACGPVSGYTTPAPQTVQLGNTQPNPVVVNCVYIGAAAPTTTVSFYVQVCSTAQGFTTTTSTYTSPYGYSIAPPPLSIGPGCFADTVDSMLLNSQSCLLGNGGGVCTFTVPQGSDNLSYSVLSTYGNVYGSVLVGNNPVIVPTITLYSGAGFSIVSYGIVPNNDNPIGAGLSSAQLLMALGAGFLLVGGVVAAKGEEAA